MPEFIPTTASDLPADLEAAWLTEHSDSEIGAEELRQFFTGYVEAMVWTNVAWGTESGEAPEGYSEEEIELTSQHLRELATDALDFVGAQQADLLAYAAHPEGSRNGRYSPWACAGHDFALTRNGHGAGFWDRGLGDLGDRLSAATKPYGDAHIYVDIAEDGAPSVSIGG